MEIYLLTDNKNILYAGNKMSEVLKFASPEYKNLNLEVWEHGEYLGVLFLSHENN